MKVLGERVNAHLPEYNTLKSFGKFSPKRFEPECSSSVVLKNVLLPVDALRSNGVLNEKIF